MSRTPKWGGLWFDSHGLKVGVFLVPVIRMNGVDAINFTTQRSQADRLDTHAKISTRVHALTGRLTHGKCTYSQLSSLLSQPFPIYDARVLNSILQHLNAAFILILHQAKIFSRFLQNGKHIFIPN
ncbi:hypothetical protein SUGI_0949450 [Cryptomeria japonica]|nr:hypothetical protein SUGI_0949450 [Cryptomeria japonica]